jgi:hypothetical protein
MYAMPCALEACIANDQLGLLLLFSAACTELHML